MVLGQNKPVSTRYESFRIAGNPHEVVNRIPYLKRGLNHSKPPLRAFERVIALKKLNK